MFLKYRRTLGMKLGMFRSCISSSRTLVKRKNRGRKKCSTGLGKTRRGLSVGQIWNFLTRGSKRR
jgi:hypothetical protein